MELELETPNVISPCFRKQLELCYESHEVRSNKNLCGKSFGICVGDPEKPFYRKVLAREMKFFGFPSFLSLQQRINFQNHKLSENHRFKC